MTEPLRYNVKHIKDKMSLKTIQVSFVEMSRHTHLSWITLCISVFRPSSNYIMTLTYSQLFEL